MGEELAMSGSQSEHGDFCCFVHLVDTVFIHPYVETLSPCCFEVVSGLE